MYFNKENFKLSKKLNKKFREQFYILFIATNPGNIKEIVEHRSMDYLISLHSNLFKSIFNLTRKLAIKENISNFSISLISLASITFLEFKIIMKALRGEILLGTLTSILQALNSVAGGIYSLIMSLSNFYNDWLYIDYLRSFLKKDQIKLESGHYNFKKICLEARNLSYIKNGKIIFENVNFKFNSGKIIGILGKNGSGKTTLLEIIHGLKTQSSGDLLFNDIPSTILNDFERITISQMLHQSPSKYEFSLRENIGISNIDQLGKEKNIMNHVKWLDPNSFLSKANYSEAIRLGEWYEDSKQISGGQWQSLAIYRLFYKDAPIYLLDEPTNNLDFQSILNMSSIIKKAASENSIIIIVSHDDNFINHICDEIYTMVPEGLFEKTYSY
ncbi:ATP-binding cassette domain-containing protein [Peribacillus sp. SCS-26]|uniref:ATP-binding cassette domain-containing protein n=1 Tax=Paraperibacillus marinus TaxID=3115295 RepID=UPI0039069B31